MKLGIKRISKSLKQKDHPSDLIVPQRQAAKKASENMRSTTVVKKDEAVPEQREQKQTSGDDTKFKPVVKPEKSKGKRNERCTFFKS